MKTNYRRLPSVDRLLSDERIRRLVSECSHPLVIDVVRDCLENVRYRISLGEPAPSFDEIIEHICDIATARAQPSMRRVINATGVILHTNLGRAPLSQESVAAMAECARGYTNLEIDLDSGKRGSRQVHIEWLLCQLTGAESALVVNNNAAAVLLALSTIARRREVIVSRGQAVEIGGGFRIPDVMRQSGAKLVEVGTTNCTYAADYEAAITDRTAAILRVHPSNFLITGFIHSVPLEELVELGKRYNLPVLDDLGSGCLLDTCRYGLDAEPTFQQSIAASAALAMSSTDKLLGGPQAGIVVGKKDIISRLQKHPLARAVRIDRIRLAGLAATLQHYLKGEAEQKVPVWRMISAPQAEIKKRACRWSDALGEPASVVEGQSTIGGGSLPGSTLPTHVVGIKCRIKPHELAGRLRAGNPPVIVRVEKDLLLLDPRTVLPDEDEALLRRLSEALKA